MATKLILVDSIEFSIWDYAVFLSTLLVSLGIGIYHALKGNKTTSDYLNADRSMSTIPIAFSFTATYLSSISILGYVGEVYGHGLQLIWILLGQVLGVLLAAYTAMPIFYKLKLTSINEYLELRFHSRFLRKLVSALNITSYTLYLGLCLYAPTLALVAVTPLSMSIYIPLLGLVVTLYSALGGLKAVVWTDTFQTVIIICGILVATSSSIVSVGGIGNLWRIATEHGRTEFLDFSPGMYTRHTAINTVVLGFISFFSMYGYTQSTLQRVGTMPSMKKVRQVLFLNLLGLTILLSLLFLCGLGVFAVYADCDPISLDYVKKKDQLLPYFIMNHLGHFKGLPGLFVACLFCGTLSSISSLLNASVAMLWTDFFSEIKYFAAMSETKKAWINKLLGSILGAIMIVIAYLSTSMSGVIQASLTITGVMFGPIFGLYLLAMLVPPCTKIGAISGIFSSMAVMLSLGIGSMYHGLKVSMLPLSTSNCTHGIGSNMGSNGTESIDRTTPHPFFGISYTYFSLTGAIVCISVGTIVTLITSGRRLNTVDPKLVFQCWRKYYRNHEAIETISHCHGDTKLSVVPQPQ